MEDNINESNNCEINNCAICLEPLKVSKFQFPCKHSFHIQCGIKWIAKQHEESSSQSCPLCRGLSKEDLDKLPAEILKPSIVINEKYCVVDKKSLHNFLKALKGRGVSESLWTSLIKTSSYFFGQHVVLSYEELKMLCVVNACRKMNEFDSLWYILISSNEFNAF
jgi:hypothetical protein